MLRPFARMFVVGTLAAAATLGAACSYIGGSVATAGVEKPDLTVAAVPSLDSAGLYIAQQRGLFAAEGLHVTIVPAISSSTVIAAQLAGKYDASLGPIPAISSRTPNRRPTCAYSPPPPIWRPAALR